MSETTIDPVDAIQALTDKLRELQRDSDHLGYINATLIVNYGRDGREPKIFEPGDESVHDRLVMVLTYFAAEVTRLKAELEEAQTSVRQQVAANKAWAAQYAKLEKRQPVVSRETVERCAEAACEAWWQTPDSKQVFEDWRAVTRAVLTAAGLRVEGGEEQADDPVEAAMDTLHPKRSEPFEVKCVGHKRAGVAPFDDGDGGNSSETPNSSPDDWSDVEKLTMSNERARAVQSYLQTSGAEQDEPAAGGRVVMPRMSEAELVASNAECERGESVPLADFVAELKSTDQSPDAGNMTQPPELSDEELGRMCFDAQERFWSQKNPGYIPLEWDGVSERKKASHVAPALAVRDAVRAADAAEIERLKARVAELEGGDSRCTQRYR